MAIKKWAVKENFEDFVKHINLEIRYNEIQKHLNKSGKNATYLPQLAAAFFSWRLQDIVKDLAGSDYQWSSLSVESTDKAGRAQLPVFARFINSTTHAASEKFICVRKLDEWKTAAAITTELEEIFSEKYINESLIRFSGLDGTNAMSGKQNCMQRKIQHVSPYALYINCHNHKLALCLVHLIKEYPDLQVVDTLLLFIWKIFKNSSAKQTIFENAQSIEGLKQVEISKSCTTRWR